MHAQLQSPLPSIHMQLYRNPSNVANLSHFLRQLSWWLPGTFSPLRIHSVWGFFIGESLCRDVPVLLLRRLFFAVSVPVLFSFRFPCRIHNKNGNIPWKKLKEQRQKTTLIFVVDNAEIRSVKPEPTSPGSLCSKLLCGKNGFDLVKNGCAMCKLKLHISCAEETGNYKSSDTADCKPCTDLIFSVLDALFPKHK